MKRLCALAVMVVAALSTESRAAELTRVASSFEPNQAFQMLVSLGYERTQQRAKIVREFHQDNTVEEVSELRYLLVDQRLNLDAKIGLWQDLEFHYRLPVVFSNNQNWAYTKGTDSTNSSVTNNCLQANGELTDPDCPNSSAGRRPLFDVPSGSFRGGLGDMTFGLAYALFNQKKDDTKPTWILGVDYTAPTAGLWDPTVRTTASSRGDLGQRTHHYDFFTALSKKLGIAEPYFRIHYTLPVRGPGWYSNCNHPDPSRMAVPENCSSADWPKSEVGLMPVHQGGVTFGTEFNAFDQPQDHQQVAVDLRATGEYFSPGRTYNPLSDALGKILYTRDYVQMGGSLGFIAQASDFVQLVARGSLLYSTEHTLTDESLGKDLTGNGAVDLGNNKEVSPNFDYRTDAPSRRFRAAENSDFRIDVYAVFNFH